MPFEGLIQSIINIDRFLARLVPDCSSIDLFWWLRW